MGDVCIFRNPKEKRNREGGDAELLIQVGRLVGQIEDEEARSSLTNAWRKEAVRLCGQYLADLDP